jgi:hypothetical protein
MPTQTYFGVFENRDNVAREFERGMGYRYRDTFVIAEDFPTDAEIRFALYDCPPYEGQALVVYERDGQLFEVNGSHCSCYGLEGQWTPELTSPAALAIRNVKWMPEDALLRYRELFPESERG